MHSGAPDYWCVAEALTPETHGGSSVCVSQFLAQQLRQRLPVTNPQVIPCGITLPTAQASFSDQPFRVVYSGRMVERQKCIHQVVRTLIHALPGLQPDRSPPDRRRPRPRRLRAASGPGWLR